MVITQLLQRRNICNRNRKHHALLRLTDPNFRWSKTLVLQRREFKIYNRSNVFCHFANRARETARATIGNGMKERLVARIARCKNCVQGFLLRDGISNLHRVTKFVGV